MGIVKIMWLAIVSTIIIALLVYKSIREWNNKLKETTGMLVEYTEEIRGKGLLRNHVYNILVQYTIGNTTYTNYSKGYTRRKRWDIGKIFKVYYRVSNPSQSYVEYTSPILLTLASLALTTLIYSGLSLLGLK